MPYRPIEDHAVIGDLHTVALVARDGTLDFLCFPHFDSPSVFAALLDDDKGGHFSVSSLRSDVVHRQQYLPDTNVLMTRYMSPEGVGELIDFMPVEEGGHAHDLVRRLRAVRGSFSFEMRCEPRFNYARAAARFERQGDGVLMASAGTDGTVLRLRVWRGQEPVPLEIDETGISARVTLHAGESVDMVLEEGQRSECADYDLSAWCEERFRATVDYWRRWIGGSRYSGRWLDTVHRSALALKLMTSLPHGSIVAAPTFGLPETIGGERNWDYRYAWIRDSAFTLYALLRLHLSHEAREFIRWLHARCAEPNEDGSLQIMYGLDGRHRLDEIELDHLDGYRGSRPVRIGNGAHDQLQLDIYGELMDAVYLYDKYGEPVSYDLWTNLQRLIDWVCANWRRPDEGIWEVRGGRQQFLYSRLMCWVAVDRARRLALKRSLPADIARWRKTRDEIHRSIHEEYFDAELGAFTQTPNSKCLDASCLLMPLVRFIGPTDPRWISTLDRVTEHLVEDTLVYRYREQAADDGLTGQEGTFSMCSFWYVECLARAGRLDEARLAFEKMLGYANHVGLYAEELGPCGEHLGNFPQAFTHLGLISAAFHLDRALSKAGWRA